MPVETKRTPDGLLTEHVVTGTVSPKEMYAALEGFYASGPTPLLLWDMAKSDMGPVSPDTLRAFVRRGAELGKDRAGGRTALVATEDLQFGFGRMTENFFDLESAPFAFRVFRSREDALVWLMAGQAR